LDKCNQNEEGERKLHGSWWKKRSRANQGDLPHNHIHQRRIVEELLHTVPINLEALVCGCTFDLNCTIRKNIKYNKRANPPRPKLNTHETNFGIIQQHFLANKKLLSSYQLSWNFMVFSL